MWSKERIVVGQILESELSPELHVFDVPREKKTFSEIALCACVCQYVYVGVNEIS